MMVETERQRLIGRMIMQILDLYSEGKIRLPLIASQLERHTGGGNDGSAESPN